MTSVAACDPELPPLLIMSGMKNAKHDDLGNLLLKEADRSRRQHFTQEKHRQPPHPLPEHTAEAGFEVSSVQGLHPTGFWNW
jgi:hypothetical protein